MFDFKCKRCGGDLDLDKENKIAVCKYCGSKQTLPKFDSDKEKNMYDIANNHFNNGEFDKACALFEELLRYDTTDTDLYWSLVLCVYGIDYVEDARTKRRIPTVNRVQYKSIYDNEYYKLAIKYANDSQRQIYEEEAKIINNIQKEYLMISKNEAPFDVFICYKETDEKGRRTLDSVIATNLYNELSRSGLKVFFARITLEDKLGVAYEPYIFSALNSSLVMVVVGTSKANLESVWVRNEWSRFLGLMKENHEKVLIPAYKDMNPYDLPSEFSHLQAQDMNKIGSMQDLVYGIKKILNYKIKSTDVVTLDTTRVEGMIERAKILIEEANYLKANEVLENVLNINPKLCDIYICKLLIDFKLRTVADFATVEADITTSINYKRIMRFGDEKTIEEFKKYHALYLERLENSKPKIEEEIAEPAIDEIVDNKVIEPINVETNSHPVNDGSKAKKKSKIVPIIIGLILLVSIPLGLHYVDHDKPKYGDQKVTVTTKGHNNDIKVEVEFKEDRIVNIEILEQNETPGITDFAFFSIVNDIVKYQTVNLDTIAGSTVTSQAIIDAVTKAIKKAGLDINDFQNEVVREQIDKKEPVNEEVKEEIDKKEPINDVVNIVSNGYDGLMYVDVRFENNFITDIKVTNDYDKTRTAIDAMDFIISEIINNQSVNIDTRNGATITSNGIVEAVTGALRYFDLDPSLYNKRVDVHHRFKFYEPVPESKKVVGTGKGFVENIKVEVEFKDNHIASVYIIKHDETPGISDLPFEEIPRDIVKYQSVDIDTISGATHTSRGIIDAVTDAISRAGLDVNDFRNKPSLEKEPINDVVNVSTDGYGGLIRFRISFEDNLISDIYVREEHENNSTATEAMNYIISEVINNQSYNVDTINGATITSNAVIDAVKEALDHFGLDFRDYNNFVPSSRYFDFYSNKMSALEVVNKLMNDRNISYGMQNNFFDVVEMDSEAVLNAINFNQFNPDKRQLASLPGFKSAAQIVPTFGTNVILVIEFEEGTSNLDDIAKMLVDYKDHMICMSAELYDSFVVDNYVFFVSALNYTDDGVEDKSFQDEVLNVIMNMSFEK